MTEALEELYPSIQLGFGLAIENGSFYDVQTADGTLISENSSPGIEQEVMGLAKKNQPIVRREFSKANTVNEFTIDGQTYKVEHIVEDLEDGNISTYTQSNFTGLYRRSHLVSVGLIKAVKITSVAGAF